MSLSSKEFDERLDTAIFEFILNQEHFKAADVLKQSIRQLFKDTIGERDELKENTFGSAVDWRGYNKTMVDRNTLRAEIIEIVEGEKL